MEKGNFFKVIVKLAKFTFNNIQKTIVYLYDQVTRSEVTIVDNKLRKRAISSLILIALAIYAVLYSIDLFILLAVTLVILMSFEWTEITKTASNQKKWQIIGFFYILIPVYAVLKIRLYSPDILLWLFFIIWGTDIAAYFTGKIFEGKKLAPSISPGKTWSGFFGGVIFSALVGIIGSLSFNGGVIFFAFLAIILSILEQISDLLESKIKRIFKVKDSGNIIPGHGGVLDRMDGITLTAPTLMIIIFLYADKF